MNVTGKEMKSDTVIPLRSVSTVNKEQYTMTGGVRIEHSAGSPHTRRQPGSTHRTLT